MLQEFEQGNHYGLEKMIEFGLRQLDEILEGSLFAGDVIVLKGSTGSFKTPLGLFFLQMASRKERGREIKKKPLSLLFTARDGIETVHHLLRELRVNGESSRPVKIRICLIPKGHVDPGQILQIIESEIKSARLEGKIVDRVMVDNIDEWQISSPAMRDDRTFPVTMVQLLRGLRVSSLLVVSDYCERSGSILQDSIVENSDCHIEFDRFEFRGMRHVLLRVMKSRGMRHRLESFEVKRDGKGIVIGHNSSLLRINKRDFTVSPIKIRFFFHIDSVMQLRYFESICHAVQAVLSSKAEIDYQDRLFLTRAIDIGLFSAVDELQIIQIDEYQLTIHSSYTEKKYLPLFQFSGNYWQWDDMGSHLLKKRFFKREQNTGKILQFQAVPFFENISLLAYRKNEYQEPPKDWEQLVKDCEKWEENHPVDLNRKNTKTAKTNLQGHTITDKFDLFFDFVKTTPENFNCLFFEILLSLKPLIDQETEIERSNNNNRMCALKNWFQTKEAEKAGRFYRRLCRRAYLFDKNRDRVLQPPAKDDLKKPITVNPNAKVWRHWYTTLNQMLSEFEIGEREGIGISSLPGEISIAGEWYLGVPEYSAAPDVALEMIKLMVSRSAEFNRVRMGIGLPTRSSFYSDDNNDSNLSHKSDISPYFSLDSYMVGKLIKNAFRRSVMGCYPYISNILAFHLIKIIEIPEPDVKEKMENEEKYRLRDEIIEGEVRRILDELIERIEFVQGKNIYGERYLTHDEKVCELCKKKQQ